MNLLIVDSSIQVIERLRELITLENEKYTFYSATSYNEATDLIRDNIPAVAILDSGLKANGTIRILNEIKKAKPGTLVIVLSNSYDDFILDQCKTSGVDLIFDKYHEFEKIPAAIKSFFTINN